MRDNLEAGGKEKVRKIDKKRKMNKRLKTLDERSSIFDNVQMCIWLIPAYSHNISVQINLRRFQGCHSGRSYLNLRYLLEIRVSKECY